jgi:hypothetical protein
MVSGGWGKLWMRGVFHGLLERRHGEANGQDQVLVAYKTRAD